MKTKIIKINDLIKKLKSKKKIIALSHGVFDLLHHGHLRHFEEVKKKSDLLIVSVTTDNYVKKGPSRPYFSIKDRMYTLSKLENVDFVLESDSLSSTSVIKKIKPHFYCKGPDYKDLKADRTKKIYFEKKTVEKFGGKLLITSNKTSILNFAQMSIVSADDIVSKPFTIMNTLQEAVHVETRQEYSQILR